MIPENIKQLEEKYGFELILKEMWVWDDIENNAVKRLVLTKSERKNKCVTTLSLSNLIEVFKNASETDPRIKENPEPKVGDWGWFWDDKGSYTYDELSDIYNNSNDFKFLSMKFGSFRNFSKTKQSWMK